MTMGNAQQHACRYIQRWTPSLYVYRSGCAAANVSLPGAVRQSIVANEEQRSNLYLLCSPPPHLQQYLGHGLSLERIYPLTRQLVNMSEDSPQVCQKHSLGHCCRGEEQ